MSQYVSYARKLSSLQYETGYNLLPDIVILMFKAFLFIRKCIVFFFSIYYKVYLFLLVFFKMCLGMVENLK